MFESGTGYFGSRAQQTMLNFRVRDLDAMLAQLRAKGADVASETQDMQQARYVQSGFLIPRFSIPCPCRGCQRALERR
ncbi:MAG TPA: hypothetical protein VMK84_34170 [Streptosporangiaceae bacterium]|nr:hypothetical protein [Streptosporangiaceae bacterium]